MPTTQELQSAISAGNLDEVQNILGQRDQAGIPIVDINRGFGNVGTALIWSLSTVGRPINADIVQVLLDVVDNNGNPVCDLNHVGPHGQTASSFILAQGIPPETRRHLLQSIVDRRGREGQLIYDLTRDSCNVPLFQQALELNDIHCLRILEDARNIEGDKALDINKVRHGTTVYDKSLTDGLYYRQNEAMQNAIRQLGGVTAANVPAEARQAQEDRWARPQQERDRQAQQQINRFDGDTQNTHDPSVTRTAAGSLTSLNSFYPDLNIEQSIQEIEQHLRTFSYESANTFEDLPATVKKQHVNQFWGITKTRFEATHSYTGYTIRKVLALVWSAIKDGRDIALTEDLQKAVAFHSSRKSDYIIDMRKSALIHQFIEANLAYRKRGSDIDICVGGAVHQLLSILNKAHSQVIISTGMQSVLPDANALATTIPKEELLKRPVKEQREILKTWKLDAPESQTADDFKNAMKPVATQKLVDVFSILLTQQQRDDIINTFEYLPEPIVHAELDKLIEKIKAIPEDAENPSRQGAITRLKEQANQAYDDRDRPFEEEYELLSKVHAEIFVPRQWYINMCLLTIGGVMCAGAIQLAAQKFGSSDDVKNCLDNPLDKSVCIKAQLKTILDMASYLPLCFLVDRAVRNVQKLWRERVANNGEEIGPCFLHFLCVVGTKYSETLSWEEIGSSFLNFLCDKNYLNALRGFACLAIFSQGMHTVFNIEMEASQGDQNNHIALNN